MSNKIYYTIRKQFQISKEKFTKNKILYNNCKTINHFPNNYNKILQPKIIHRKNHSKIVFEEGKNSQDSNNRNNNKNGPEYPNDNILFMCLMAFSIYICNKHTI